MAGLPTSLTEGHILITTHRVTKRIFQVNLLLYSILHITSTDASLLFEHKINWQNISLQTRTEQVTEVTVTVKQKKIFYVSNGKIYFLKGFQKIPSFTLWFKDDRQYLILLLIYHHISIEWTKFAALKFLGLPQYNNKI